MKTKFVISALAACVLVSGTAMADGPQKKNRPHSGSVAAGVTAAGPGGAVAAGGAGSASTQPGMTRQTRRSGHGAGQHTMTSTTCIPNSVATTSNNTAHIGTTTASGASSTSATGQGSGAVSAASDGGVYAARDRNSAEVDAYGTSTAQARPSRRC